MHRNPKTEYKNTDAGMAERVRDELRGIIAHNKTGRDRRTNGNWHRFNGYIWEPIPENELYNYVIENVIRTISGEDWSRLETGRTETELLSSRKKIENVKIELINKWESRNKLIPVLELASAFMPGDFDKLDALPFSNGVLTPEGILRPYKPDDYFTACIPTDYIKDAPYFPAGEKFFAEISAGRPDWVTSIFSILGYCLIRGNPEQVFFVFKGGGANGKGVLLNWLNKALGSGIIGNISGAELRENNRDQRQTRLAACVGKSRMMVCNEQGGAGLDDELIKTLSGDNTLTLKVINTGVDEFEVVGTLIMVTNQLPAFGDGGKSMQRREIAVPFDLDLPINEIDPGLLDKLATPVGNAWLVSRVVNAYLHYRMSGNPLRSYLCGDILEYTAKAFREQDIYFDYIEARLIREAGAKTLGSSVFYDFMEWRYGEMQDYADSRAYEGRANTICKNPNAAKDFYEGLIRYGIIIKDKERIDGCKNAQRRILQGWRLRTDKDDEIAGQLEQYL